MAASLGDAWTLGDEWVLLGAERDGTLLGLAFRREYIEHREWVCPHNLLPLIVAWYTRGELRPEDANQLLSRWWVPGGYMHDGAGWRISRATLVDLFDFAGGFVTDDPGVSRPSHPLTIWRGGVPGAACGLSWSTHFGEAEAFALWRAEKTGYAVLWTTTIAPLYVLGIFNELEQDEVVIDPSGLGEIVTVARYTCSGGVGTVRIAYDEDYADSLRGG